jgi:hypothetical protein
MGAMRAPSVIRAATFESDISALRSNYPQIDDAVGQLEADLQEAWAPPHIEVDALEFPGVYAVGLDYPPLGAQGTKKFLLIYHATAEARNKMSEPLRTYRLLSIAER